MFGLTTGGLLNIFGDWSAGLQVEYGCIRSGPGHRRFRWSASSSCCMYQKMAQSSISFRAVTKNPVMCSIVRVGMPL